MKKYLLIILTFFLSLDLNAQTIVFPFQNQIKNQEFETAENGIFSELTQNPNDCALNYAAGSLYFEKEYSKFDYQKAYDYLKKSKNAYNATKDKSKLLKAGLSANNINKKILTVTQYALDQTMKINSAEAYEQFLSYYDLAPQNQRKIAENKSIIYTFRKHYSPSWDYIRKFINQTYDNQEFIEILKDSAFSIATRNPNVEIIKYCYMTSKDSKRRDSCVSLMHKIYEKCGICNFDNFWQTYTSSNFKEQKEEDEIIKGLYKSGDKFRLVLEAAPKRAAYDALLDLIAIRLRNKDYEGALYKVSSFKNYFEGNKDFADLLETLQKPENKDLNIIKLDNNSEFIPLENTIDTTVSTDGSIMICAERKQFTGEVSASKNLFIYFRQPNGTWSDPQEIGGDINTAYDESSPFLHPDMQTLYFSSNGHGTLGKSDIFVCKRLDKNSWHKWSRPKNLGREINSPDEEKNFKISFNGTNAYFTRFNGAKNTRMMINLKKEEQSDIAVTVIYGKLTDSRNRPVGAEIGWEDLENHQIIGHTKTSEKDGSYTICLPSGRNYGYFIDDKRFFPTSENIDLRQQKQTTKIQKDINVVKIEEVIIIGKSIVLKNLFFKTGQADLLPTSHSELERISKMIQDRNLKVEISGHTDNVGNDTDNQKLSLARANAVKNFLVQLGCDSKKLITVGHGKNKPIASNNTTEGRQQNRRVEFRVIK